MAVTANTGILQKKTSITLISFGFKYGVPDDVEFLYDVRSLRNPYYVPHLKSLNGNFTAVADYVMEDPLSEPIIGQVIEMVRMTDERYQERGRGWLVIGLGCTGGRHRSVAVVNELKRRLTALGYPVDVLHRDIDKEIDAYYGQDPAWTGFKRSYAEESKGKGLRVAAIGGGTGMPAVLRGLKHFTSNITAIVTVTDDGGSSGKLIRELDMPPPGDVRNCILALSNTEPLMEKLFQYRFMVEGDTRGHPFGNLFLAAMTDITGDFQEAIRECAAVLSVRGEVVPATMSLCRLKAEMADGSVVYGESHINRYGSAIRRLHIEPGDVKALPTAIAAIMNADIVIIGPGSLYTSIITNLLIPGIADALRATRARKVYVCNTMTEAGETNKYTASDHVKAMSDHAGDGLFDTIIVNSSEIPRSLLDAYIKEGASRVQYDRRALDETGLEVLEADVASAGEHYKHDPIKLGKAIMSLIT